MTPPDLPEALGDTAPIPLLCLHTDKLPPAEAFEQWRQFMAPLFHIEKARHTDVLPRGNVSLYIIGEIMVSRNTFNAQRFWRDPVLIAATPHHLVLQYYRAGGFCGTVAGRPAWITRGQVAVGDLSQTMDAVAVRSDTIGLSVPRALLAGIDPMALRAQLDAARNRRLGAFMATLPRRIGAMCVGDIPKLTAEIVALLTRVFAAGSLDDEAAGVSNAEYDLLARAMRTVETELATPDLSPAILADLLGTSRSSLYRLFVPVGGIMQYVQERRLHAACGCLSDVLDKRSLLDIATAHGFTSQAHFSRAFRARFGMTPRAWREQLGDGDGRMRQLMLDPVHRMWRDLGRGLQGA